MLNIQKWPLFTEGWFLVEVAGQLNVVYIMAVVHQKHMNSISLNNEDALTIEKVAIALAAVYSNSIFLYLSIPK